MIVDGYNIINAWPELRSLFRDNIEAARDKLIEIMAGFQAYKGIKVIVVFDGHLVKGNTGTLETVDGVQVIYTREHETADSYIEKSIKAMSKKGLVRVATSDWTEQQVIMAMGGIRISASELRGLVQVFDKDIKRKFLDKGKDRINTVDSNLSPDVASRLQKWRKER